MGDPVTLNLLHDQYLHGILLSERTEDAEENFSFAWKLGVSTLSTV
jgi:hypothetical protein